MRWLETHLVWVIEVPILPLLKMTCIGIDNQVMTRSDLNLCSAGSLQVVLKVTNLSNMLKHSSLIRAPRLIHDALHVPFWFPAKGQESFLFGCD